MACCCLTMLIGLPKQMPLFLGLAHALVENLVLNRFVIQ